MLLPDSAFEAGGVTLYRDHLAPGTFYYLPGAPRVVVDGVRVGLQLLRYRGARSGGLLLLAAELALPHRALPAGRPPGGGGRGRPRRGGSPPRRAAPRLDSLWCRADLDREAESLEREGHVTTEDVDYSGDDPVLRQQRRDEIRATLHELTEAIF